MSTPERLVALLGIAFGAFSYSYVVGLMGNLFISDEIEYMIDLEKKKLAIEKFARREDAIGYIKDPCTGLTVEDKIKMQLDNQALYEDWQLMKIFQDFPISQTNEIMQLLIQKQTRAICFLNNKRPRFVRDLLNIIDPILFFEDE